MNELRKIGILGGTFDPIHNAHLMLGEIAYRQFGLDEVLFMPAKQPPHKTGKEISPVEARIAMVRLAIANKPYFSCSDFELGLQGKSYTAQTLTALHELDPEAQYYFILGGDSLFALDEWYEPEVILQHAVILAAVREDHDVSDMQWRIKYLTERFGGSIELLYTPKMDLSASEIRERVQNGESISGLVPGIVETYIRQNGLYYEGTREIVRLKERLSQQLNAHRYEHTLGVAETARRLAGIHGADAKKAYLTGLLHDCAKCYSDDELLALCEENDIEVTEAEKKAPYLLHAKYGAWLAEHVYQVKDKEVCAAIASHTTGKPEMNLLEKIIFVADYLEPGRTKAPHLKVLRKLVETDMELTIVCILQDTLNYLRNTGAAIDPMTEMTYHYYDTGNL